MFQVIFLVLSLLSFFYWACLSLCAGPRGSVLYFWLFLGAFFAFCAAFPFLWYLLRVPFFLCWALFFLFLFFALPRKKKVPSDPEVFLLLGCRCDGTLPSAILENRVKLAANLLKENPNTRCILSGGKVFREAESEAKTLFFLLLKEGISPHRLILEEKSRTTKENLSFSFALLPEGVERVGVITSSFHLFRARRTAETCSKLVSLSFYGAKAPILFLPHLFLREWFTFTVDLILGNIKYKIH